MSKKPPDKYKCIKLRINNILDDSKSYNKKDVFNVLNDAISRTNKITIKSYMLLRLWILKKYENNIEIPLITKDIIKIAFKSVIDNTNKQGKRPSGDNLILLKELKDLFKNEITDKFENGTKLSTILNYYAITMMTSIENNIKNNFINYINRYVNSYFITKFENEIKNKDFKKQLFKDLKVLKKDIYENTNNCDDKYKLWLNDNRNKVVPIYNTTDNNIYKLLKNTPQKCLKYMIYMNKELEILKKKQFQFFPLQTKAIVNHIQIDTSALIELFENKVTEVFKNIEIQKAIIWTNIFKLNKTIKNYVFDYTIITDGFSTALRFLHKDYIAGEKDKKDKMKLAKSIVNNRLKGLTKEEQKKEKELIKNEKELIKINNKEKLKKERDTKKTDDNNKPEITKKELKDIINDENEFKYITDVNKEQLKGKHIFIDPGKRSLLTMMDDNNDYLNYTNKEHMEHTKRLIYRNKLDKHKTTLGIQTIENKLVDFNSKSCIVEEFKKYINMKLEINVKLLDLYNDNKFRQYKWYSFINKKRAEDKLLNKIENTYSKNHIIIMGDWSIGKQMANFISTPNLGLKRKLKTRFKVYNIDEFRTSCLNYKTEERCENLYLPSPKTTNKKKYKMHSILTFKMENNRLGCINRDKNGCQNIKKLFNSYINTGTIPERYRRGFKID